MSIIKPSSFLSSSVSAISGTHDDSSVYYQRFFISRFTLDNRAIEAKFSSPMKIHDGDAIAVSGYAKGDAFQVLAYVNKTQGVSGRENWIVLALGALFFLAVAIGLLNSEFVMEGALVPKLFLVGFVGVAMYMMYRALLIREAISLLQ